MRTKKSKLEIISFEGLLRKNKFEAISVNKSKSLIPDKLERARLIVADCLKEYLDTAAYASAREVVDGIFSVGHDELSQGKGTPANRAPRYISEEVFGERGIKIEKLHLNILKAHGLQDVTKKVRSAGQDGDIYFKDEARLYESLKKEYPVTAICF